jgi:hypothetical protein
MMKEGGGEKVKWLPAKRVAKRRGRVKHRASIALTEFTESTNLSAAVPRNNGDMDAPDVIRYFDDGCHSPASLAFLSPQRKLSSVLGMGVQFLTQEQRVHDQRNVAFVEHMPS